MENSLIKLKQKSKLAIDSCDYLLLNDHEVTDATTNPSLILKVLKQSRYRQFVQEIKARNLTLPREQLIPLLIVNFGKEILKRIPGRVSTEVSPQVAYNVKQTVEEAYRIRETYLSLGENLERILIKIPATYEGIKAASELEKDGVRCNMTLIFSEVQSLACADAGAAVISPFVGRVGDWYKMRGRSWDLVEEDPGVRFVRKLKFTLANYDNTEIMGASFRNIDQIIALAGLDLLTISPELLDGLKSVDKSLDLSWMDGSHTPVKNKTSNILDRKKFDELLAGDVMATDKLVEGIKLFQEDSQKFERMILSDDLGKACAAKT